MTVQGWENSSEINYALAHEHVMVDFIGAAAISSSRYNSSEVFAAALPKLIGLKKSGCAALFECTPAFLGRDPVLMQKLSVASGVILITNTGYYGASNEKFLPQQVYALTAEELADIWTNEFQNGIEDSGIRPGFIKLGVDAAPLSTAQRKTVQAGALTHLRTGLTIGIHTGNGAAAEEELEIISQQGVSAEAFIWIHAQNEKNVGFFSRLARKGAWIEFDQVNRESLDENIALLQFMKSNKLLHKTLVSQDSGWYNVGQPGGEPFNGYTFIFSDFIPLLLKNGFNRAEVDQVFKYNPREAFAVKIRKG